MFRLKVNQAKIKSERKFANFIPKPFFSTNSIYFFSKTIENVPLEQKNSKKKDEIEKKIDGFLEDNRKNRKKNFFLMFFKCKTLVFQVDIHQLYQRTSSLKG